MEEVLKWTHQHHKL